MATGFDYPRPIERIPMRSAKGFIARLLWRLERGRVPTTHAFAVMLGLVKEPEERTALLRMLQAKAEETGDGFVNYYWQARAHYGSKPAKERRLKPQRKAVKRVGVWERNCVDAVADIPLTKTATFGMALYRDGDRLWLNWRIFRLFTNDGKTVRVPTRSGGWIQAEALPAILAGLTRLEKRRKYAIRKKG